MIVIASNPISRENLFLVGFQWFAPSNNGTTQATGDFYRSQKFYARTAHYRYMADPFLLYHASSAERLLKSLAVMSDRHYATGFLHHESICLAMFAGCIGIRN